MNLFPLPCLSILPAVDVCLVTVCEIWSPLFERPEEREGQFGWGPGSLRDDSWAGCGNQAPKEVPTEICRLLAGLGPWRVKVIPWDLALSGQDKE